jgi:hypothetical protein
MKKIPTLFVRDWDGDRRYVLDEISPGCEWVAAGEGTPTRKYDGTCVMFDGSEWWARREVKAGRSAPANFVALESDEETGKTVGWEPIGQSAFARWHAEALDESDDETPITGPWPAGTYELIGPKVNGDPERYGHHALILHGYAETLDDAPRDFSGLAAWLHAHPYEGIVWHHEDGRMAKIKKRDFRPPAASPDREDSR